MYIIIITLKTIYHLFLKERDVAVKPIYQRSIFYYLMRKTHVMVNKEDLFHKFLPGTKYESITYIYLCENAKLKIYR